MTEMELKLTGGRIVSAELKDGVLKILVEEEKEEHKVNSEVLKTEVAREDLSSEKFALVPASTLSLTDKFMFHTPKNKREQIFKDMLTNVIKSGISDFYRPRLDPSLGSNNKIIYIFSGYPAVGKSYNWWEKNAKEFCPERKSRLGTKSEYVAFLGILIKKLVESGWKVDTAWDAVCNDSKNLGHYCNSEEASHNFELTGSREICGFYDLANAYKFLAEDKEADGFWFAGGFYYRDGARVPLASFCHEFHRDFAYSCIVGWLVLEK